MRHFRVQRNHYYTPILNIDKLWSLVPEEVRAEYSGEKKDKAPVIDVTKAVSFHSLVRWRLFP